MVSGKLEYLGADALARTVESPYHERTEVRGEAVTLEREGSKPQHFSLQHAPELRSLLGSFAALLSGDAAGLKRDFELDLTGDEESWTLKLTPRDAHIRQRIPAILVAGRRDEPRCIITQQPNDTTTVMLVAQAAEKPVPAAVDRDWFDQQCK